MNCVLTVVTTLTVLYCRYQLNYISSFLCKTDFSGTLATDKANFSYIFIHKTIHSLRHISSVRQFRVAFGILGQTHVSTKGIFILKYTYKKVLTGKFGRSIVIQTRPRLLTSTSYPIHNSPTIQSFDGLYSCYFRMIK